MKVLIVTYYRYPDGDAGAVRQHNLAKLYERIGCDVTIVGMGNSSLNEMKTHEGIKYTSFRHSNKSKLTKLKNILFYTKYLKEMLYSENKFDVIHLANTNINILLWLKYYKRKRNILLVHDSVEWYSAKQFKMKFLSPSYIFKSLANNFIIDKNIKVISISNYLQKHFEKKGIETIRIPIVFDANEMRINQSNNSKLVITYAGSPGKKDYIEVMLKGISKMDQVYVNRIEFRIFGVDENTIKILCDSNSVDFLTIKDALKIYGRVDRKKVVESLGSSDFSVMLRDSNARYAKAGFPTKIVESLTCGTPVITNISSDLGEYLVDTINCIIVESCDSHSFAMAIQKALSLNNATLSKMKMEANKTALKNFDIDLFRNELRSLLNSGINQDRGKEND
ncbi:glycosyltransferase [Acetoanaerobium noterae]|uniref:glycosyltransferase n=1 Tax=Acetoanaerobium noterae TaxID=745369 RepID=UPI00322201FB